MRQILAVIFLEGRLGRIVVHSRGNMFRMGGAVGMTPGPVLTNLLPQARFLLVQLYLILPVNIYFFIYPYFLISPVLKDIVGLLSYSIHVPRAMTVFGKTAFMCAAPLAWNNLQQELKLSNLIPLHVFKARLNEMLVDTMGTCKCL